MLIRKNRLGQSEIEGTSMEIGAERKAPTVDSRLAEAAVIYGAALIPEARKAHQEHRINNKAFRQVIDQAVTTSAFVADPRVKKPAIGTFRIARPGDAGFARLAFILPKRGRNLIRMLREATTRNWIGDIYSTYTARYEETLPPPMWNGLWDENQLLSREDYALMSGPHPRVKRVKPIAHVPIEEMMAKWQRDREKAEAAAVSDSASPEWIAAFNRKRAAEISRQYNLPQ